MDAPTAFQVKRKPIPRSTTEQVGNGRDLRSRTRAIPERRAQSAGPGRRRRDELELSEEEPPPLPPRPRSPDIISSSTGSLLVPGHTPELRRAASAVTLGGPVTDSPIEGLPSDPPPPYSSANTFPAASAPSPAGPSFAQTALSSARDLAARFKPLPTTTTKHYTVALHSSPLVIYRGSTTSISLTIFTSSFALLPPGRTLWLQRRGLSGDTGSRLKALVGATGGRIEVTPVQRVASASVDDAQERAWVRDISRVGARLARRGGVQHLPRETHVVRIPGTAEDGYFRVLVIGGGGKQRVLCSSPVFRVASASADASVLRGASLLTLPLEVGVKVASTMATVAAGKVVGPVAGAATQVVGSRTKKYRPALDAAQAVYGASGVGAKVTAAEGRYAEQARGTDYEAFQGEGEVDDSLDVVGPDEGPQKPYPLKFQGKVVRGTGKGRETVGVPTANLSDVPDDIKPRLKGVYFGWACIMAKSGLENLSHDWHEAIISAGPSPYASPATVLAKTTITVHMIYDFEGQPFFDAKVRVIVMGFLRHMKLADALPDEVLDAVSQDVWLTMASLSRENWGPLTTLDTIKAAKTARTFSDKYIDARVKVQKQVERIPAHWAGIRTAGAELRDQAHGKGGYWIPR